MKKIDLNDRESIAIGILRQQPLSKIAKILNRSTSSISREIKNHRIFVAGSYYAGNDCVNTQHCTERHLCGDEKCPMFCYSCNKNCHLFCSNYSTTKCLEYTKPPFVCNGCSNRRYCNEDRYFYDARVANKMAHETRKAASEGVHLTSEEVKTIDQILSVGIKNGQPISHLFATYENELIISERTAYRLIEDGILSVRNVDLRRKARYKKRHKKNNEPSSVLKQNYRKDRSYQDFLKYMQNKSEHDVVEIDTVKGRRGVGKVLLTMLFRRNSVMIIFVMPDCKAESVIEKFDFLEKGLGTECFKRLFGTVLTDNGSEFKRVNELEGSCITPGILRSNFFYCDPMASGQKGRLEKNHEYIRYVLPKGTSFNAFSQEDFTLLANHINSVRRPSLYNLSPYEVINPEDNDMRMLMKLLSFEPIPADEVNLTNSLLMK